VEDLEEDLERRNADNFPVSGATEQCKVHRTLSQYSIANIMVGIVLNIMHGGYSIAWWVFVGLPVV